MFMILRENTILRCIFDNVFFVVELDIVKYYSFVIVSSTACLLETQFRHGFGQMSVFQLERFNALDYFISVLKLSISSFRHIISHQISSNNNQSDNEKEADSDGMN